MNFILIYCLLVFVYPEVKSIEGKLVKFVDGREEEFDLVVFATGYKTTLPMIDHLLEVDINHIF